MTLDYDPRYQEARNSALSPELRERIGRFRSFSTLAEIASAIGFSAGFTSQILNSNAPANVDSKHIPRIVRAVEKGEAEYWEELGIPKPASDSEQLSNQPPDTLSKLKGHIRSIEALGFRVVSLAPM